MIIAGKYSFNKGLEAINKRYSHLFDEVESIIAKIDASKYKTKKSKEKTMPGRVLYSPRRLNIAFCSFFLEKEWLSPRVKCEYSSDFYANGYESKPLKKGAFRQMDFVKEKLGVEIQFGKYAFMVYNVCAKMTIFNRLGFIDAGIEIVPIKNFADEMSTGVSYFEQFVWDLEQRGVSNIDIPVLILGIDK
ncbi:MAG: restriction endonuclease [Planctomycetes bacterium RBG_13_46_10]|nr:MAG: restriction endonuclease [Planctomycetes bacterium RBG_13_46_10]